MTYKIVVGVDASPHSAAALRWAVEQATSRSGEVMALLCWQLPFFGMPGGFDRDEVEARAKALLLQTVKAAVPDPPVPLETVVAEGDPIVSLLAASDGADLLVLGTRGRSPFAGLLLGSVSQACSAHAPLPRRTSQDDLTPASVQVDLYESCIVTPIQMRRCAGDQSAGKTRTAP
jgi:nucleotide-binding universal stress UspA family protein